jgi:hypothetical protein
MMSVRVRLGIALTGITVVALALTGCTTTAATQEGDSSSSTARMAAWKDVWVCMLAQDPAAAPSVFFGSEMYPGRYWLNGKTGTGAVQLSPRAWVCNSSIESAANGNWLPDSMDTFVTITWPNGRPAQFGIQNPLIGTPKFYPSLVCSSSGPNCSGESKFSLDEGDTFACSTAGFDFTIKRNTDTSDFKYFEIVFGSPSAITDDFDFESPLCTKK